MKSQIFLIGLENVLPDVQPEPAPQKVTVRVFIGDEELTHIVRTEIEHDRQFRGALAGMGGRRG